jgi:hypothetical protein
MPFKLVRTCKNDHTKTINPYKIGYDRGQNDFTVVQNFVTGYNEQTYEQLIKKIEIKTDPAGELERIRKKIDEVKKNIEYYQRLIAENISDPNRSNAQKNANASGLNMALGRARQELAMLEKDLAFAQAVIVDAGGKITDNATGETVTDSSTEVIGTGKTPAEIEADAGRAKMALAMKKSAEAVAAGMSQKETNGTSAKIPPLAIAAAAGIGAYMIAKG